MVCFGKGAIDWNAVSAVGSILASLVALFVAWLALKAPEWGKRADRREASAEVLSAAEEAIGIYREACDLAIVGEKWPTEDVVPLRIRAAHLHETLDRLISRPWLTDGMITVGAGAMSILSTIRSISTFEELREARRPLGRMRPVDELVASFVDCHAPALTTLEGLEATVKVVRERMARVQSHAAR